MEGLSKKLLTSFGRTHSCNDIRELKSLIVKGADVNFVDSSRKSIVHYLAQGGYDEALHYVLHSGGADVDAVSDSGTPLILAAQYGHYNCVCLLLQFGANPILCHPAPPFDAKFFAHSFPLVKDLLEKVGAGRIDPTALAFNPPPSALDYVKDSMSAIPILEQSGFSPSDDTDMLFHEEILRTLYPRKPSPFRLLIHDSHPVIAKFEPRFSSESARKGFFEEVRLSFHMHPNVAPVLGLLLLPEPKDMPAYVFDLPEVLLETFIASNEMYEASKRWVKEMALGLMYLRDAKIDLPYLTPRSVFMHASPTGSLHCRIGEHHLFVPHDCASLRHLESKPNNRYLAPELVLGAQKSNYTSATMYSFAIILYELVVRRRWLDGYDLKLPPSDVLRKPFRRPRGIPARAPYVAFASALEQAWDRDPKARVDVEIFVNVFSLPDSCFAFEDQPPQLSILPDEKGPSSFLPTPLASYSRTVMLPPVPSSSVLAVPLPDDRFLPPESLKYDVGLDKFFVGEGSFGDILKARCMNAGMLVDVAVKVAKPDAREEFLREYHMLSSLSSDCIVICFGWTQLKQGLEGLVLECASCSLHDLLLGSYPYEPYTLETPLRFAYQLAGALQFLSDKAIVHGDVKSKNVLYFDTNNTVKLCDFGHAFCLESSRDKGSPDAGSSTAFSSLADDVYAFAFIMWELFTHGVIFSGYTADRVRRALEEGERPSFPTYLSEILCALIESMWGGERLLRPDIGFIYRTLETWIKPELFDFHSLYLVPEEIVPWLKNNKI